MTWTMLAVEVIYWMERAAYNGHSCILTFLWKLLDINYIDDLRFIAAGCRLKYFKARKTDI